MLFIRSKFEKNPEKLEQVMTIFVSGAKRNNNAEYEEKDNFEGAHLKDDSVGSNALHKCYVILLLLW